MPVDGGYRVTGRWPFGTGCQEAAWMLGSFQILDGDQPRRSPDGSSVYWRGVFERSEVQIVEGTWDVLDLRATGSFDWTVDDVFLPERRVMVHAGVPLDNQWKRWPGVSYALPAQGVGRAAPQRGDHRHRPGRDRCADRAGRREDTARSHGAPLRGPAGAGRRRSGRHHPQRRARLPECDDHRGVKHRGDR